MNSILFANIETDETITVYNLAPTYQFEHEIVVNDNRITEDMSPEEIADKISEDVMSVIKNHMGVGMIND